MKFVCRLTVTRLVPLEKQNLFLPVFNDVHVARSLAFILPSQISIEGWSATIDVKRSRIRKSKKNRQHNSPQKSTKKQRSTKHTHKTKDPVTRTTLKTGI
jgi:hypothetical protein